MTTESLDNRIVRAAQKFFDSITFSLNIENDLKSSHISVSADIYEEKSIEESLTMTIECN